MAADWRPDPAKGVFETLLVLDGSPVEWDAHMARLQASLAELFPDRALPSIELEAPLEGDALRIDVVPVGEDLETRVSLREVERHERVSLRSLPLAGGLGAHKWADRSHIDAAEAEMPDDALPLIRDENGAILEASRANVFAMRDGALFTPPLDGRILPGVTRMRVLEIAASIGLATHETPLVGDDLLAADEVFLTGSVCGIEPAATLDGTPLGGGRGHTQRLAAELRRAWTGPRAAASFG